MIRRLGAIANVVGRPGVQARREEPVVLRYGKGCFFKRHRDVYERPENAAGRRLSLVAFLTGRDEGAFHGGELRFFLRDAAGGRVYVRVPGRTGQFVIFAADVEHEVLPVLAGERITLVSWLH